MKKITMIALAMFTAVGAGARQYMMQRILHRRN